jgi:hypothetical protein
MVTPPHWPQPGLGASVVQGYAQAAGLPTNPQELLSLMPVDVQAKIQGGLNVYGNLGPAISVAQTISSGVVPNEAAVIAGVSAAASVISPLAGAAMGAAGAVILGAESLMQSFFDLLGLYDHPRLVKCCGLRVASSIPYGPDDPQWLRIRTLDDWNRVVLHGGMPGLQPGEVCDYGANANLAGFLVQLLEQALLGLDASSWPSTEAYNAFAPTAFDRYFAALLRADLENWANCNPYLQPRQLLMAAQIAWNQTHRATSTFTYTPTDGDQWNRPGFQTTLPSAILGNSGDPTGQGNRAPPLVINTGPLLTDGSGALVQPRTIALHIPKATLDRAAASASPGSSTATKVAAGTAVVGGAATLGVVIFSLVKGQAVDAVLGHAWKHMKGWFR